MGEEDDEQGRKEMNGHVEPVPVIQVAHAEEVLDPFEDIDRSTGMLPWLSTLLALTVGIPEYRVRTLYPYDGQRAEDLCALSFRHTARHLLAL
jgi:hypothetical protein